jgi:hypothetical protein
MVAERTGGVDPDWALFYAWWLLNWSDFPDVLGRKPSLAELTVEMTALDAAYRSGPRDVPCRRLMRPCSSAALEILIYASPSPAPRATGLVPPWAQVLIAISTLTTSPRARPSACRTASLTGRT